LATFAAGTSGSALFTVLLSEDESTVPDFLDVFVSVMPGTMVRTGVVALGVGETNLTVDAGLVRTTVIRTTPTPTTPTSLPEGEQPEQQTSIYLPTVQSQ
jgi:hypothetical protein